MRKYLVFYWKETGDDCDWFERIVEASSLDEAISKFRKLNPLVKIDSIELITKDKIIIRQEIPRSILENVFVTALEGGSNYWCYISNSSRKLIRDVVPQEEDPYLATAMLKAILDHNVIIPVNDCENPLEIIGHASNSTIQKRLQLLSQDEGLKYCLESELLGNGDAATSDVVFQYITMGECIYG